MAALPAEAINTRLGRVSAAIYEAHASAQEDPRRPHLGASVIGKECQRQIWYQFRWVKVVIHDGRLLLLFGTGHLAEPRFVADLQRIGATVVDKGEDGKQFSFKAHGGHFGGSLDGVATGLPYGPKTWAVLEFKTHGSKSFATLKNKGVKLAKPEHYAQMQVYMMEMQLERALYLAKNKDTDELHDEWITLDKAFAEQMKAKALAIITADIPPAGISAEPGHIGCKWCDYQELCFGSDVPQPSCRSCAHSTPVVDRESTEGGGIWHCGKWQADVPVEAQKEGCSGHRFIPIFLARTAEAVDYHNDDVVYRVRKNGKLFANGEGPGALSSEDIWRCPDKPGLAVAAELKGMFPTARVIG